MLKVEFRAMGCQMSALLGVETAAGALALQTMPAWFEEWEQILSRFRSDSELSCLNDRSNRAGGEPVEISQVLSEVLSAALQAAEWSQGLVTPCVLADLEKAGYDRSFEELAALPAAVPSISAPQASLPHRHNADGWRQIRLDTSRRRLTLPPGLRLDFGGVAKGWAAQQAVQRLSVCGPALVDAGGDIAISGLLEDDRPWPVAVGDPLQVQERLDLLALGRCGVATSGIDYRRWRKNGAFKHHLIDPRTGEPAETDLLSVTVVAPSIMQAETAAKVVLLLGSQAGLDWLESQPELAGLLAFPDGRVLYSSAMRSYSWS